MAGRATGKRFRGCKSLQEFVGYLKRPRKIMLMVKAGPAVDQVIEQLVPLIAAGDIIIDGGNSHFADSERRVCELHDRGLLFVGSGVSGGEEGALLGPSLMPGGAADAWPAIRPIFESIAARVGPSANIPCCAWIGSGGSGHYVKMVHNGIEYGDMQLICEAYWLMKQVAGLDNDRLYDVFESWNQGELNSYLIEITRDIFSVRDDAREGFLVDHILDRAGAKGTGKWMSQLALDLGVPSTLVSEAVFARGLSTLKDARRNASKSLRGPQFRFTGDCEQFVQAVRGALYASKICSYAQGFVQLAAASREYNWKLNLGDCALIWRGGCIIRAAFLDRIKEAFDRNPNLENLLLDSYFQEVIHGSQQSWREVVAVAAQAGVPVPALMSALSYYDAYRSEFLPANLLQAQRDYFGAHEYERMDRPGMFHTDWIRARRSPNWNS
jgi:6-phosphogluconate dehydrogenase